jgi:hypothetical protein
MHVKINYKNIGNLDMEVFYLEDSNFESNTTHTQANLADPWRKMVSSEI